MTAQAPEGGHKYVVTSALPYINGVKHLGNLVGSLLPADIYSRFRRQRGDDVLFVCGTDEHGTPAELAAEQEGMPVADYAAKYWRIQKDVYERFGLSFDYFGRTSSPENHDQTQEIFKSLDAHGLILERRSKQLFCIDDQRYLPDRFVLGTCPRCHDDGARGDQCEACGTLLDPEELIDPRCHHSAEHRLEEREENHLYMDLPSLAPRLSAWIDSQTQWQPTTLGIAKGILKEGLQERCITRNLKWGVAVPRPGYEDKVFYVWFDAPIGYIGISREWSSKVVGDSEAWREYWENPETRVVHFLGKDNVPFHTLIWPGMLIGGETTYTLPWFVKGFNWLNYEGDKFSTSKGRGVFTDTALELFPADWWRYYLLTIAPEKNDSSFTWDGFHTAVNKDLADVLGNLLSRVVRFIGKYHDGRVPPLGEQGRGPRDLELIATLERLERDFETAFDRFEFGNAMRALRSAWAQGNKYLDDREPWALRKTDLAECGTVMNTAAHYLRRIAYLSSPIVPSIAADVLEGLNLPGDAIETTRPQAYGFDDLQGHALPAEPRTLIEKIDDEAIEALRERFSGRRAR